MSLWITIPLVLAAWCAVSLGVALMIGPVLALNSKGPQPPASGDETGEGR